MTTYQPWHDQPDRRDTAYRWFGLIGAPTGSAVASASVTTWFPPGIVAGATVFLAAMGVLSWRTTDTAIRATHQRKQAAWWAAKDRAEGKP